MHVYAYIISDQLTEAADIFARTIADTGGAALLAKALARGPFRNREGPLTWARSEVSEFRT
jgi:hypothetical protein